MQLTRHTPSTAVAARRPAHVHGTRLVRLGWGLILGALLPLGGWLGWAPLSMAVVAPAIVKVDLNRRPVQHLEGGIVREVFVRDGQHVEAGAPLVLLGDVRVDAEHNRLAYRMQVERATLARLEAAYALRPTCVFPPALQQAAQHDARVAEALRKEAALFQAQRAALTSEGALLHEQQAHVAQEIRALQGQIQQANTALALQTQELEANRALLARGLIAPTRLAQLEAVVVDYAAKLDERRSELARAEQRLVDSELRRTALQNRYVQEASDQLKVTAARLSELEQEHRKVADAATRQIVTAPASGTVIELKFTSPGAVVRPGEPIAEIVPSDAQLLVEAYLRPGDITHVHQAQRARIRFTAFKYRTTAMVTGTVTYVSADRLLDRATNLPYYSVLIQADAASLHTAGEHELTLQAGMPAEVYLEGATVTPLQYLLEPIASVLRKAGRDV
jgi:membrane fusion protein, type I secretion system